MVLPALLAVPAMDTSVVILSRLANGRKVTQGGVDHVSHRLVRMGCSKFGAALAHAAASLGAGTMAALAIVVGSVEVLFGVVFAFALLGFAMLRLDMYSAAPLKTAPATETGS